jgi:acetyl esterase/lipase
MGFSAGGHLAATAATHYDSGAPGAIDPVDRFQCRPDFSILIYPVITMSNPYTHLGSRTNLLGSAPTQDLINLLSNEKQVNSKTCPAFLVHGKDDAVVNVANSQMYYDSCLKAKVPAQMHLFAHGPHGFGMGGYVGDVKKDTVLASWPWLCAAWLKDQGFLTATTGLHPGFGEKVQTTSQKPGRFNSNFDFLGRFRRLIHRL